MRRNSTEQSGWEKLKSKPASQTVQQRDVYETQDLERSRIEPKKTSGAYDMTCLIVGAAVAILVYFMISAIQWGVGTVMSSMPSAGQVMEQITTSQANPWENGSSQDMTPWGSESGPNWAPDVSKPDYPNVGAKIETGNYPGQSQAQKPVQTQPAQKPVERSNPFAPSWLKILVSLVLGTAAGFGLRPLLLRRLATQNAMRETTDINQYPNDQHIAYPEEIYERYDWFPDAGAHANVSVTTLISHAMLSNKGLKRVKVTKRLKKDIVDENGDIVQYAGEPVYDANGNVQFEEKPLIDEKFGREIYEAAYDGQGVPKEYQLFADTTEIEYNPGDRNRNKQKGFPTVAELINATWHIPYYETQRPAGAFLCDTSPANTISLTCAA